MRSLYFLLIFLIGCSPDTSSITTRIMKSNTTSLLQAISILNESTIWVSGHDATFCRTIDSGEHWQVFSHPTADTLQFRDLHALDQDRVVLMSAGPGALSRIFIFSVESGWEEVYVMPHEQGFLNTIEFWDQSKGLAFGDSFNGELFILKTEDGGQHWSRIDPKILPPAGEGEGGFAASGTCIATQPEGKAWIGTGAGGHSRVLYTGDYGTSWAEFESPLIKGEAAGITSIRMAGDQVGTIVGGDLAITNEHTSNTAVTFDGGRQWALTEKPVVTGAFYGSDIIDHKDGHLWMACGPKGIDFTFDHGQTWKTLDSLNYWAIDLHPDGYGFAAGTDGKLLKIVIGE